jgi:hypothetical protein
MPAQSSVVRGARETDLAATKKDQRGRAEAIHGLVKVALEEE